MTQTTQQAQGEEQRMLIDSYRVWTRGEGVPIVEDFAVDLRTIEVRPWDRLGLNGAIVNVAGRGDFLDMWLLEIPAGGQGAPQHHLFEAVAYVISGRGSTVIETPNGEHTFEWGPKSMFALPLNAPYQLFNGSGQEPARVALTTAAPISFNLYKNADFLFGMDFSFTERVSGPAEYFTGVGTQITYHHGGLDHHTWETNFVPDLELFTELRPQEHRGKASKTIMFMMAEGVLHAHMSDIPKGIYKKAHRHMGGTHIYPVTGLGYSLLWYEGETERKRIDWCHGYVYSPPDNMYHQHFNLTGQPARYFAVKMGNVKYPVTNRMTSQFAASSAQIAERKTQIEYENEDPAIRALYLRELERAGIDVSTVALPS